MCRPGAAALAAAVLLWVVAVVVPLAPVLAAPRLGVDPPVAASPVVVAAPLEGPARGVRPGGATSPRPLAGTDQGGDRGGDRAAGRGAVSAAPLADVAAAEPITAQAVGSTVGQLISEDGGRQRLCSATLVASRTKSVVVTAAHCVYTPPQVAGATIAPPGQRGWVDATAFVPGADGGERPFGVWEVEQIAVDPRWQTGGDPVHDVAFLRLAPRDGQLAGDVLGAQGIGEAADEPPAPLSAIGYPAAGENFTGDEVLRCSADAPGVEPRLGGDYTIPCDMTEGSSGGPWLAELDETTGLGVVVAVTSLRVVGDERIAAARLGPDAMALFAAVDDEPDEQSEQAPAE